MKFSLSSIAIGIVALACLLVDFSLKNWEKEDRVIEWDVHSYYEYLPAYFIYDDIKFEKSDYRIGDNKYLFWPVYTEDGRKVIKMSMGTAFFYAPFFFVAHAYASVTDYPEDGFSIPYKIFLLLSTIFYLIVGLEFVRKILHHYGFSDKIIATVILLIGLGTNMLCYASQSAPMSHIYSFCAFGIFIFYTIKWYREQTIGNTLMVGFLFGLISLIRPTNSVIILFFILYGISTFSDLKDRVIFLSKKYFSIVIMILCTLLVWIPQIIYWKASTGKWMYYSYNDEGFFFGHPHIIDGLFSWRKGWLVYTPMMAFALIGLFFLRDELKKLRLGIIAFMVVNIYIIFSWWCWWYGGTLGQRSFIESYGLLAIPLAALVRYLFNVPARMKALLLGVGGLVAVFFIWLNIFQTYQFEFHALHYDGMSKELYFEQFGKMEKIADNNPNIHWPSYEAAMKGLPCETPAGAASVANVGPPVNIAAGKTEVSRKSIQLKAFNGKFVCADEAAGDIVIANRDSAQGWETFTLIEFENNEYAILSHRNRFFTIEKETGEVMAVREAISKLATFLIETISENRISIKTANDQFLVVDEKTLKLKAGDSAKPAGMFELMVK